MRSTASAPIGPRLPDLGLVEREVLAEHRESTVARTADEVFVRPVEVIGFGQHRDRRRTALLVLLGRVAGSSPGRGPRGTATGA
jgi:hypothetical protein